MVMVDRFGWDPEQILWDIFIFTKLQDHPWGIWKAFTEKKSFYSYENILLSNLKVGVHV